MALSPRERARIEKAIQAALANVFDSASDDLADMLGDAPGLGSVPASFWTEFSASLREALGPLLSNAAAKSAVATFDAASLSIGLNWNLVNLRAAAWATRYSFDLVKGITDTSRDKVSALIADFIERPGQDLANLGETLGTIFGEARGDMIAITEATRASAMGEAALRDEILREFPQAAIARVWRTSNDETVCEICAPLNGVKADEDGQFNHPDGESYDSPPAHPRCRCAEATLIALPEGEEDA